MPEGKRLSRKVGSEYSFGMGHFEGIQKQSIWKKISIGRNL